MEKNRKDLLLLKLLVPAAIMLSLFVYGTKEKKRPKILVFSKTAGFHHASITDGNRAVLKLGAENGFKVDTTTDAAWFNDKTLKKYAAVMFLNTTGDVLNDRQQAAFERYIRKGRGYVGVHAATDTEFGWPWYGQLAGAYFINHPAPQEAVLNVVDNSHPSTRHLPQQWKRKDEWYNFKNISSNIKVLITIDEKSYRGGANGDVHPMAWYQEFDGGRAFTTALGHTPESYTEPMFIRHLLGGIEYAIGKKQ